MAAARQADEAYRSTHDGWPITRDAVHVVMSIAGPGTTKLRR